MEPVSSVTAFIARYVGQPDTGDDEAAAILAALPPDLRLVIEAQAVPPDERLAWLRGQSGRDWSAAWLAHVEQQALVALRRELQRRGLLRP